MTMAKRSVRLLPNNLVTSNTLYKMAAIMYPFYHAVANYPEFAEQWSKAVVDADIDRMQQLLLAVAPSSTDQPFDANGIGYVVLFELPTPVVLYGAGTSIVPGTVQFSFETNIHRAIAKSVSPLYRKLVHDTSFRLTFAKGIRNTDRIGIARLVRGLVKTTALKRVAIEDSGITLSFKYSESKYTYENMFFRYPF